MTDVREVAVTNATDFANKWPLVAVLAIYALTTAWLVYTSDTKIIALAEKFGDHLMAQNRSMTAMMERCVVVPDETLKKLREN